MQNEYFLTRHLNNDETTLHIDFKGRTSELLYADEFEKMIHQMNTLELHFYEYVNQQQIILYEKVLAKVSNSVTIKVKLHTIHMKEDTFLAILTPLENRFTMNLYHFKSGTCTIEYFGLDIIPFDKAHNQRLMSQLKQNWIDEKAKPVVNEKRLKQELIKLNRDYEALYDKYLYTHQRMQYAFRTLHQFKRSAWKYKKKYLEYEVFIRQLDRVTYYQKRLTKKNVKKGLKLIWKKVKS
ncbi:hypothetical protein [Staphylococcus cornubiensis]|uniref:hypothetical protein n=1 Tax=Staphylococcus cornubiensis TaxID=1986155 RepID=UPI000A3CBCA8|nr:hypothetical protein [Staphylococcus cornubiensis]